MVRIRIGRRNRKAKTWAKIISGVDRSAKGGYAIEGEWVGIGKQEDHPEGALIALADNNDIKLLVVGEGQSEDGHEGVFLAHPWINYRTNLPDLLDAIEACLGQQSDPREMAIAEILRLAAEHGISLDDLQGAANVRETQVGMPVVSN